MHVTTRFVGTQRGGVQYLIYLLTEEYIEANQKIAHEITPALERFARDLSDSGTLVRPFPGSEERTLADVTRRQKLWDPRVERYMMDNLPGLLITSVDFDDFDPRASQHTLIFLRDLIDKNGNVEVFSLQALLKGLLQGAREGRIFDAANEFLRDRDEKQLKEAIEVKPSFAGVSLDLRKVTTIWDKVRHRAIQF